MSFWSWGFTPPKQNSLYGHPHKPKRPRKIRLHRAHKTNPMVATPKPVKPLADPFRRSTGYNVK